MEATKPAPDPQTKPSQSNGSATTEATLEAIVPSDTPVNPWVPDAVYSGYIIPELRVAVRRAEEAEEQVAVEAAARQQAEERAQALEAELARLRRQRS